jgi:glycosyltransferase involved in cell wall biosynthesis
MAFHVVLDKPLDLDGIAMAATNGERPGHAMAELCKRLDASLHFPDPHERGGLANRLRSRLVGSPGTWALAKRLAEQTGKNDVIFCASEHTGYPLAATLKRPDQARVSVMVHNVDRPRTRAAFQAFTLNKSPTLFLSPSKTQIEYFASAGVPEKQRLHVMDQTDTTFFAPGVQRAKTRPLIVSVGLEQRDYRTLAAATGDLDLDVRISGFSTDAALLAETFPEVMPSNFQQAFYEWGDLAQLYRDADVVVVAVRENRYAAGVQALLEAMASGRPVVVTESTGLAGYMDDRDALSVVPQGDPDAMRRAILDLLINPSQAEERAKRARQIAEARYSCEKHVSQLEQLLRGLAGGHRD